MCFSYLSPQVRRPREKADEEVDEDEMRKSAKWIMARAVVFLLLLAIPYCNGADSVESRLKERIFTPLAQRPCVRLMTVDSDVGCSTTEQSVDAVFVHIATEADIS